MEWFDTNVGSGDAALKQRPEVLKAVGVNLPINVFLGMVNNLMGVLGSQSVVGRQCVGVEGRASLDMLLNFGLQHATLATGNYLSANLSATFKDAHNSGLVLSASTCDAALLDIQVHVASLAADEGFVNFDFSAELAEVLILQGQTNAMEHEPCGLLSYAEIAGEFTTADSVLAVGEQPQSGEPLIEANGGILAKLPTFTENSRLEMMLGALPSATSGIELANLAEPQVGQTTLPLGQRRIAK